MTETRSLMDAGLIADVLNHDAAWSWSHGADGEFLGGGLLYYALTYVTRAEVAVCLGSGGGFVPRLMRQAQRDAGIADRARTILVDANLPEAGWGSPQWLDAGSFFRTRFPDVELVLDTTAHAAETRFAERIDYLHIDADHSLDGCFADFERYRPFLAPGSLVTLHDTRLGGAAGVGTVVDRLRGRADCELVELAEVGTGTALVRIVGDDDHAAGRIVTAAGEAAVAVTRPPGAPRIECPATQWKYLLSPAFAARNVLAAHFVRDCRTVVEIGGWLTPIDRFLTGRHEAVVVVDPFIRDAAREELNGAPCHVRHVRARFQDLEWEVRRERGYGLVILGLDLEGLGDADEAALHRLVERADTTVIEFPGSWPPSRDQFARMLDGAAVEEHERVRLDLAGNDFGDLSHSWPPRVERELHVLRPRRAAGAPPAEDFAAHWRRLTAGDPSAAAQWRATGGQWTFGDGGVEVTGDGSEWVSLEWDGGVPHVPGTLALEVTVAGEAEAGGLSFGSYQDLLARLPDPAPRHVEVTLSPDEAWEHRVDGAPEPREWWNGAIGGAGDLRGGRVTLKARHARRVRFTGLLAEPRAAAPRLSVVLTCHRFLQRLRPALRTWCEQDLPAGELEILVVDPASPDGTAEHLAAVARGYGRLRVVSVAAPAELAANKGALINRGLAASAGGWVWIADADCLAPPGAAREALRQAEAHPRHLYFLRRRHLSPGLTAALLAGRVDPVRDFDLLAAVPPSHKPDDHGPWGYGQLVPRAALEAVRYREDVEGFARTDGTFAADLRSRGYRPRALTGLVCLHLDHPFAWDGTTSFL